MAAPGRIPAWPASGATSRPGGPGRQTGWAGVGWGGGLPQKRNPDAAELIRAKAARIGADFAALNAIVQKLPLAYAKVLQEDKTLTFSAFDDFALSVTAMIGMIETIRFNREAMRASAAKGYSTATDLADWLVRELKVPFREAHESPAESSAAPKMQVWLNWRTSR